MHVVGREADLSESLIVIVAILLQDPLATVKCQQGLSRAKTCLNSTKKAKQMN